MRYIRNLVGNPLGIYLLGRQRFKWEDNKSKEKCEVVPLL
jgi:hypothetical protein